MSSVGSYTPGGWVAVTTAHGCLLADLPIADPRVTVAWNLLREGPGADAVLELLLTGGLSQLPGFALVTLDEGAARVVVRRPARVEVGETSIDATSGTWMDTVLARPLDEISLSSGEPMGEVMLPVAIGVTQASSVMLRFDGAGQGSPELVPFAPAVVQPDADPLAAPLDEPETAPLVESASPESDEADSAPAYDALFAGTANRIAFLDQLAAERREADDGAEPAPEPESRPHAQEPSNVTAVWSPTLPPAGAFAPTAPPSLPASAGPRAAAPSDGVIDGVPWAQVARPYAPTSASTPPQPPGATATSDQEIEVRTMTRAEMLSASQDQPIVGPSVLAVTCPSGHLTAPFAHGCRVCGQPVDPSNPTRIARPSLGMLRREGGDPITLDRDVVLGRAPQAPAPGSASSPHLVKVGEPGVSRSHLQLTLDGWQVFVRDLGSSNGTELQLPGRPSEALRAEEDYLAEPGSRIVIAGEVTFVYEVTG